MVMAARAVTAMAHRTATTEARAAMVIRAFMALRKEAKAVRVAMVIRATRVLMVHSQTTVPAREIMAHHRVATTMATRVAWKATEPEARTRITEHQEAACRAVIKTVKVIRRAVTFMAAPKVALACRAVLHRATPAALVVATATEATTVAA